MLKRYIILSMCMCSYYMCRCHAAKKSCHLTGPIPLDDDDVISDNLSDRYLNILDSLISNCFVCSFELTQPYVSNSVDVYETNNR